MFISDVSQQEYEAASGNWEFSSYTGYSGSILLHTQLPGSAHSNPGPGIPGRESQLSILLRSLAVQGSGRWTFHSGFLLQNRFALVGFQCSHPLTGNSSNANRTTLRSLLLHKMVINEKEMHLMFLTATLSLKYYPISIKKRPHFAVN